VEELGKESWLLYDGSPRGVFRCAKVLEDDGVLVLMEGLGDFTLPYGRDVTHELRLRPLDRDLATAGPHRYGPAAFLAPPAARPPSPPASSAGVPHLAPPVWGAVSRPYTPRGGGRYGRSRRTHPGRGTVPLIGGRSGPPVASLPLFSWDGAAQLGTPRPVRRAVWDGLARFLGELPPIPTNGVDHTLMMALSRTLVRLRNEMAVIVSRAMADREADVLYSLRTVVSIRRLLAEQSGAAVAKTNTVLAGWFIRNLASPSVPAGGGISPATPQRPPSTSPPHYGVGPGSSVPPHYGAASGSVALPFYGAGSGSATPSHYGAGSGVAIPVPYGTATGPSATPPTFSGPGYYSRDDDPGQGYNPDFGSRSGAW